MANLLNEARKKRTTSVFKDHPQKERLMEMYNSVKGKRGYFDCGNPYYDDYGQTIKFHFE